MALPETREILTLAAITFAIAVVAVLLITIVPGMLQSDPVVDYQATLYLNGTLVEDFVYNVQTSDQYNMLYRDWGVPMSLQDLGVPQVVFVNITSWPPGTLAYLKDHNSNVWIEPAGADSSAYTYVEYNAYTDEAGIYGPSSFFPAGSYHVQFVYQLKPPLEYDANYVHLNLLLASAGEHLTYRNVTIIIMDAQDVVAVYPHPPSFKVDNESQQIVLTGSSSQNELLEVELLMNRTVLTSFQGYPTQYADVVSLTTQANNAYSEQYYAGVDLSALAEVLLLVIPALFVLIWAFYGRESPYTVPHYVSTTPNKDRKPWLVNLVFDHDPTHLNKNALYATVLDLSRQGKIKITPKHVTDPKELGFTIEILSESGVDGYEGHVLEFLKRLSVNGVVDTEMVKNRMHELSRGVGGYGELVSLKEDIQYLTYGPMPSTISEFVTSGRRKVVPFVVAGFLLCFVSIILESTLVTVSSTFIPAIVASIFIIIQSFIAISFPMSLFGRWKGTNYQERLEWESFKRFLSDHALIEKYAPQDLSVWGEWLVYGTALGVGHEVEKAMKDLNVKIPELGFSPYVFLFFHPVISATARGGAAGGGPAKRDRVPLLTTA